MQNKKTILLTSIFIGIAPFVSRTMESEQKRTKTDSSELVNQSNAARTIPTLMALASKKIVSETPFGSPAYYRESFSRLPLELTQYLSDTARKNLPSRELLRITTNGEHYDQYLIDPQGTRLCLCSSESPKLDAQKPLDSFIDIFDIPTKQWLPRMSFQTILNAAVKKNPIIFAKEWAFLLNYCYGQEAKNYPINSLLDLMKVIFTHSSPNTRRCSFSPAGQHFTLHLDIDRSQLKCCQKSTPDVPAEHTPNLVKNAAIVPPMKVAVNYRDLIMHYPNMIKYPGISKDYESNSGKDLINFEESIYAKYQKNGNPNFYKICPDTEKDPLLTTARLHLNKDMQYKMGLFSSRGTFLTITTTDKTFNWDVNDMLEPICTEAAPANITLKEWDLPLCDTLDELAKEPIN